MPRVSSDVVIVGVGETTVGKLPGYQPVQIQAWAVEAALADHCLIRPHLNAPGSMMIFDGMNARAPMAERRRIVG